MTTSILNQSLSDTSLLPPQTTTTSSSTSRVVVLPLEQLSRHLTCALCEGYFKDAHTITECLHTFCKSCLFQKLATSQHCPTCQLYLGEKANLHIHPDRAVQAVVDKLFPEFEKEDEIAEAEFYRIRGIPLKEEFRNSSSGGGDVIATMRANASAMNREAIRLLLLKRYAPESSILYVQPRRNAAGGGSNIDDVESETGDDRDAAEGEEDDDDDEVQSRSPSSLSMSGSNNENANQSYDGTLIVSRHSQLAPMAYEDDEHIRTKIRKKCTAPLPLTHPLSALALRRDECIFYLLPRRLFKPSAIARGSLTGSKVPLPGEKLGEDELEKPCIRASGALEVCHIKTYLTIMLHERKSVSVQPEEPDNDAKRMRVMDNNNNDDGGDDDPESIYNVEEGDGDFGIPTFEEFPHLFPPSSSTSSTAPSTTVSESRDDHNRREVVRRSPPPPPPAPRFRIFCDDTEIACDTITLDYLYNAVWRDPFTDMVIMYDVC